MTLDHADLSMLQKVRESTAQVIADLKARPDYPARSELTRDVGTLDDYGQNLRNALALDTLTSSACQTLIDQGQSMILPLLNARINANIALARMGPLNTARTITPDRAQTNNTNLSTAQDCVQSLNARLLADMSQMDATTAAAITPQNDIAANIDANSSTDTATCSSNTSTGMAIIAQQPLCDPSTPSAPGTMTGNIMTNTDQTIQTVQTGDTNNADSTTNTENTDSGTTNPVCDNSANTDTPPSLAPSPVPGQAEITARFAGWVRAISGESSENF